MKTDEQIDKVADALPEVEAKTVRHFKRCEDQALPNNLDDTLAEAGTVGQALNKVQAEVLIDQLPHMLPEAKAKALSDILSVLKFRALSDPLAKTLAEREAEIIGDRVFNVEADGLIDILVVSIKES